MFGGTRLTAATRSPPTASVRLRRSVVVVTIWMRSCARPGDADASQAAMSAQRNAIVAAAGKDHAALPCSSALAARTQMLFGIRQWTFFSVSEIAPTRQSIATLASP